MMAKAGVGKVAVVEREERRVTWMTMAWGGGEGRALENMDEARKNEAASVYSGVELPAYKSCLFTLNI